MVVDLLRCALPREADPDLATQASRPFLRDAALEALADARSDPRRAGVRLKTWFRKARKLGSHDRPVVAEAVHGMIRHEALLIREGCRTPVDLHAGWCRIMGGDRLEQVAPETPAEDFATALGLPFSVAREWLGVLGHAEAEALGAAMAVRAPTTLRANRRVCSRDQLGKRLRAEGVGTEQCVSAPDGLVVTGRHNFGGLDSFRDGWFEVQDEGSQLVCEAVPLLEGDRVIDLCAGAGGKSLALAARGAVVQAHDVRSRALSELDRRAKRAGTAIEVVDLEDLQPAQVVLVDAPCSGTGRLRREPALRWTVEPRAYLEKQRSLLTAGGALVEKGGYLVYATCSLVKAENGHPAPEEGHWEAVEDRWLWPHRGGTDGFAWRTWRRLD